jgi:thioredoxin 1
LKGAVGVKRFSVFKINTFFIFVGALLVLQATGAFASSGTGVPQAPVPGMVTMVDIGAKKCIPCKMMAPIMEELEKEYKDKAAIVFIDVWENPGAGEPFGIQLIPTQIFYDAKGKEMFRHEGFMEKAAIVAELEKLGVK